MNALPSGLALTAALRASKSASVLTPSPNVPELLGS
jgi:hypothetical protein